MSTSALANQRLQSDNATALSGCPESYSADMNVNFRESSVPGANMSSEMRPDPVAETSRTNGEQTHPEIDETDVFGGGFDIFMSGVTIHFKPLRYDHIRDWVVNKLGDVYAGIQSTGIADVENGLILPSFVRRLSEDGSSHVLRSDDVRDTDSRLSPGPGNELSFLLNTVSGIYYFLNPSDDSTAPQGSGTHSPGRDIPILPVVTPVGCAQEDLFAAVHTSPTEEPVDNSHLKPEVRSSFESVSDDEDYDVVDANDDGRTDETTEYALGRNLSTSAVTENTGNPGIIDVGNGVHESDIWEVVSHDDADDWDIAVSSSR
ncbi:hypothetical protein V1509DRAFT_638597 [Lipomyces kononenkoae]